MLLIEVLLAGVLPPAVLLAVEEMVLAESLFLEGEGEDSTGMGDTGGGGGVATFWRLVCALVLLAPFLFC